MADWLSRHSPKNQEEINDEIVAYVEAESNNNVE